MKNYLLEKPKLGILSLSLMVFIIYDSNYNNYVFVSVSVVVTILLILMLFKTPRIFIYLFIFTWLMIVLYHSVFITANLSHDIISDRDEAAEIATTNFLQGKNPWSSNSILDLPITTGPSSIILSIPSVFLTNKINSLTFLFWISFLIILLVAEYKFRNNTFIILFLLFLIPILGFQRTINFSLDEIYYALIFFPVLIFVLNKNLFYFAGFLFALIILSRLSYVFLSAGFYFGWIFSRGWETKNQIKLCTGFFVGIVLVLTPFLWVSGSSIFQQNFITNSIINSEAVKSNNQIFSFVRAIGDSIAFPMGWILVGLITLLIIYFFSLIISRHYLPNPFWNVSFAALLTFTIPFSPFNEGDYTLSLIIPAFYAIAFSKSFNNLELRNNSKIV